MTPRALSVLFLSATCGFAWASEPKADKPAVPVSADHAQKMAAGLDLFKNHVRTLLVDHCLKCHGGKMTKGEFDLNTREGLLKAGPDGVAVFAGDSKRSRFIK